MHTHAQALGVQQVVDGLLHRIAFLCGVHGQHVRYLDRFHLIGGGIPAQAQGQHGGHQERQQFFHTQYLRYNDLSNRLLILAHIVTHFAESVKVDMHFFIIGIIISVYSICICQI